MIIPTNSLAQLDERRERNFQNAFDRYSNQSPENQSNMDMDEPDSSRPQRNAYSFSQNEASLSVRNNNTSVDSEIFAFGFNSNSELQSQISLTTIYNIQEDLLDYGIEFELDDEPGKLQSFLFQSVNYQRDIAPGSMIIVRSSLTSISSPGFENITLRVNREQQNPELTYHIFGEVNFRETSDTQQRTFALLTTFDFNPCLVEVGVAHIIQEHLEEVQERSQLNLAAQCILAQDLEGKIFASIALIDKENETVERIDLNGELTLRVAESLFLRYSFVQNGDESLISPYSPSYKSDSVERNLNIASQSLFISDMSRLPGAFHGLSLEYQTDEDQECIYKRSVTLGAYDSQGAANAEDKFSEPLFLLEYSNSCDSNRKDEEDNDIFSAPEINTGENIELRTASLTELSFGNTFVINDNQARVLSFKREESDTASSLAYSFTYADTTDDEGAEYSIYEADVVSTRINDNGLTTRLGFNLTRQQDESIVSISQSFSAPVSSDRNRLRFQRPMISDIDRARALSNPIISDTEIQRALRYAYEDLDLGLCNTVDCFDFGYTLSASDRGGLFITFTGETVSRLFDHDFELYFEAGLPLTSNDSDSLGDSLFIELGATSYRCDNTREFCATFKTRRENGVTNSGLLLEYEF